MNITTINYSTKNDCSNCEHCEVCKYKETFESKISKLDDLEEFMQITCKYYKVKWFDTPVIKDPDITPVPYYNNPITCKSESYEVLDNIKFK